MAVKLPDGKIARTQPEQVKKNMDDIESIKSELDIIKEGIASAYKIQGSEDVADLNVLEKAEDMNGYVYNMLDAGNLVNEDASTLAVQIGDNVVFVWNGGDWYWDRLAGLVDTSNLCTLDTDQEITGEKTFNNNIKLASDGTTSKSITFQNSYYSPELRSNVYTVDINAHFNPRNTNSYNLGGSGIAWKDLYLSGVVYLGSGTQFTQGSDSSLAITLAGDDKTLRPSWDGHYNLGASGYQWKDLYLSGIAYTNKIKAAANADVKITAYNNTDILSLSDSSIRCGAHLLPTYNQDKTIGLNADAYRWAGLYLKPDAPISDGTNSLTVVAIPKKVLFVQATHAPQTSGTITIESYTLTADEMALIDTTKKLLLCPAKTINSGSDPVMALVSYNSTTGVLQYLNYGTGVSLSEFYLMQ